MNNMHDSIDKILITENEIIDRTIQMAHELSAIYKDSNPLVVGILKGCIPFFTMLTMNMDIHLEMDFMVASSYHGTTNSSGNVKILKDLDTNVENRDILIVEDIIDTGQTLAHIVELFKHRKAKSVKICTLVDKPGGRTTKVVDPDFVGFTVPNAFIVGFGLDYDENYRNFPYIGILKEEVYKA